MLQAYEGIPEPSVLLACGDSEPIRLLAIVLEGFGYQPLECRGEQEARDKLAGNSPCAALVDLSLEAAEAICSLVVSDAELPLVVLLDVGEDDPDARSRQLGALGWERLDAAPERILQRLRQLIDGE